MYKIKLKKKQKSLLVNEKKKNSCKLYETTVNHNKQTYKVNGQRTFIVINLTFFDA